MIMKTTGITLLLLLCSAASFAKDIRIVTPYFGTIHNQLAVENMEDLDESAPMGGLYFQWINPEKYQWNVFLYGSQDINESNIFGSHFIFDYYFGGSPGGKYAVGAGLDYIRIDTDGEVSSALANFKMTNNIYAPYIRGGKYFNFGDSMRKVSLLPWVGYEQDIIRGDLSFILPPMAPGMPPLPIEDNIKKEYGYALLGSNVNMMLHHFIEITLKYYYKISLDDKDNLNTVTAMCNIYLNRHIGLSYQFKYIEVSVSKNTYHIGGLAFMF
jgi:hypothetical protein